MKKLLIATHNPGKFTEYKRFLSGLPIKLVNLDDLEIKEGFKEKGKTFKENAIAKALFYAKLSGLPTIGDDGGLEIDALNGEPGIKSRRWPGYKASDQELINFTLEKLKGIPPEKRGAQLICVLALATPKGKVFTFDGIMRGMLAQKPDQKIIPGYPFRSFFFVPKFGKLIMDLSFEQEKQVNHRYQVVKKALSTIKRILKV